MKLIVVLSLAALAVSSPLDKRATTSTYCYRDNCFRGFLGKPVDATPFCLDYLGRLVTETATVTAEPTTVTSTSTEYEWTDVVYYSTVTLPPGVPLTTPPARLAKRDVPNPTTVSSFLKYCDYLTSRISSGCSCFLGTEATSTVDVLITTSVTVTETTNTFVPDGLTLSSVRTVEWCDPSATPSPTIINGGFDDSTTDISPWYIHPEPWRYGIPADGGRIEITPNATAGPDNPNYITIVTYIPGGVVLAMDLDICLFTPYWLYISVRKPFEDNFLTFYQENKYLDGFIAGNTWSEWRDFRYYIAADWEYQRQFIIVVRRFNVIGGPEEASLFIDNVRIEYA
ncbi:hypothetical protein ABW19_dt0205987 [Dactylella cylindrospora]|nr:hypothetical protein ABW19_dt0205987 [Dactylella cylindrospora]